MARSFDFYDFDTVEEPIWAAVAFPEGGPDQVPTRSGVYRFVSEHSGDKQTLFADTAPSTYGATLRECYCHHVMVRNDKTTGLYRLYINAGVGFEHFICSEGDAVKIKQKIISDYQPHFNMISIGFDSKPIKKPFAN